MKEAEFNQIADDLMFSIEETIDDSGVDIDYENTAGMLTLTCDLNGSQIILSRQPTMSEIWLAAQSGGFHFKLNADQPNGQVQWRNTVNGELLSPLLCASCSLPSPPSLPFDVSRTRDQFF